MPSILLAPLLLFAFWSPMGGASGTAQPAVDASQNTKVNVNRPVARATGTPPVQYVIVIMQENRSTDNLFHGLPNADIADSGMNSKGQKIALTSIGLVNDYDPVHQHPDFVVQYDGGKLDGADLVRIKCGPKAKHCPPPNAQFKYVVPKQVAPYFQMAETYAFADKMFQTNQGPSYAAHQFIISATAAPDSTSTLFASETPNGGSAGCAVHPNVWVQMIDPLGHETLLRYPCFEHATLTDLLDNQQLTWRYYAEAAAGLWNGPNSIAHIRNGPDWSNDIIDPEQVLTDISQGQLSNVSWVTPRHPDSDHPGTNNGTGPSWIASIVNAVGASSYWNSCAIFITWDDWGGWYDHVKPPVINSYEYGFRVPLVIVSPFARPGYVSHATHDFNSIVRFVEEDFGLPSLGFGDAHSDDLYDVFDFGQAPRPFHNIAAPHDAHYFLTRKKIPIRPSLPDDDDD